MPDYNALRATVKRLVGEFASGRTVTLTRDVVTTYDPISDTEVITQEIHVIEGVNLPQGQNGISSAFDDNSVSRLNKIIMPALGLPVIPQPGDKITVPNGPDEWVLTDIKRIQPDGDDIIFVCLGSKTAEEGL